jgi:hypothetical protein
MEINPSAPRSEARRMPFDKLFGHEFRAEWPKASSSTEGLRVDTERRSEPDLRIGVCLRPELRPRVRRRMYQKKIVILQCVSCGIRLLAQYVTQPFRGEESGLKP